MAEDTRTQAPLITDDDLDHAEMVYGRCRGNPADMLEEIAPRLRARWVAEALEEAARSATDLDDLMNDRRVAAVCVPTLRALAAEYRAGTR